MSTSSMPSIDSAKSEIFPVLTTSMSSWRRSKAMLRCFNIPNIFSLKKTRSVWTREVTSKYGSILTYQSITPTTRIKTPEKKKVRQSWWRGYWPLWTATLTSRLSRFPLFMTTFSRIVQFEPPLKRLECLFFSMQGTNSVIQNTWSRNTNSIRVSSDFGPK